MSGAVDESTRQSIQNGRETLGAMLSSAQSHLQKVFLVAVFGLMGTIYVLRKFVWTILKNDLFNRMDPAIRSHVEVVAITPFDVILLQVKIGIVVGLLLATPLFLWYSRDGLRNRGLWPSQRIPAWKLTILFSLAILLFLGGITYAYELFFPLMFSFLATNAVNVGFEPTYSIVKWAEFVFLVAVSFGLAAELPLVMSGLAYSNIVSYETFRDKWRHAMVVIFTFGALCTPPDPITQIMWASPLAILYGFSLKFTQLVVTVKRSGEAVDVSDVVRARWNVLAGVAVVAFAAVYGFFTRGGVAATNRQLARLPPKYQVTMPGATQLLGFPTDVSAGILAFVVTLLSVGVALFYLTTKALAAADRAAGGGPAPASAGAPGQIDVSELTAGGVRAAPPEVFQSMTEDQSVELASQAMDEDDPEKARAILDRFDEVQEAAQADADQASEAGEAAGAAGEATAQDADDEESGGTMSRTAAGMMNAFTEEETTEDDIGGYYYDMAFIMESLMSKMFRIVGVFMVVLGGSFFWLYQGGIRSIKDSFFSHIPGSVQPSVNIVTLHPVEALIFEIKFSTVLAIVVTIPLILYYAWPALKERGLVRGDPRVMLVWGGSLLVGIAVGSLVGFVYVAPAVISWLAADAIHANMIIAYRINNFGWLVIYTTVGIGLLAEIPVTMVLFHVGNIVSYHTMAKYWREVVVAIFALSAFGSPRGVFTMLLIAIPATLAYLAGLIVLWLVTLGGRRGRPKPDPVAD